MATLFATTVAGAKPTKKDYKLSDGAGLYLLVRPNGSKLWRFNYVHHGKHRTLALGAWPDVGLADARGKRDPIGALRGPLTVPKAKHVASAACA